MSTDKSIPKEEPVQHSHVSEAIRKMLLVGMGAALLAQEEGEAFVKKLREKGEIAETESRNRIRDFHHRRKQKAEEILEKNIDMVLQRMDIPTRSDFRDLSAKISELSKKLDGK